jgi:tetratricopeptide (TPR) repeat protein
MSGAAANVSSGYVSPADKSVQVQRDAFFTGREAELKRVCDAIEDVVLNTTPASASAHLAVLGASGTGKSALVSQALLSVQARHTTSIDDVCFIQLRGSAPASAEDDLLLHARSLPDKFRAEVNAAPSDVLSKFKDFLSRVRFVAIIDDANADGLQAAARWIPKSSARHVVIVTCQSSPVLSRMEHTLGRFDHVTLSGLDGSACVALVCRLCKHCSFTASQVNELKNIAERSQHLPLAVRLFGIWSESRYCRDVKSLNSARTSFIDHLKHTAEASASFFDESAADLKFRSDYLSRTGFCDESGIVPRLMHDWVAQADIADKELTLDLFPRSLLGTVRLAFHELDRTNVVDAGACRQLLSILALCPSSKTPWSLFLGHDGRSVPDLQAVTQREGLERIVPLLRGSGLVHVEADVLSVHRVLQLVLKQALAGGVDAAVRLLRVRLGEDNANAHAAQFYRGVLPSAYHIVKEVQLLQPGRREWCNNARERIAALMDWLGGGALEVEIRRDVLQEMKEGDDGVQYATCASALARALSATGQHDEAAGFFQRALEVCERVLPHDSIDVAAAMLNTAACYFELGRHAEALDLEEKALAFRIRVLSADHPDIATAMLTAANNYSKLGRYEEALNLEEKALALRRRVLPAEHPDIASAMLNTATSYFALCRHDEALDLFERALELCRRVLPADHLDTATAMLNTAISYTKAGRHAEALDLHMQVLALRLRVLPADHPDIATAMLETASSYYELGRHEEALDLEEQALALHRRVLPADHPDIASAMLNTAISYTKAGRHAEALDLHMQVLALRLRVLPADHPDIATAMLNTASSYCQLGRHSEALDLNEQALAFRRRVLSADHLDIATAMLHSAISCYELGRYAEALDLQEQLLALRLRVLPADHPDIASAMLNVASALFKLGRHEEVLRYKQQVLALRQRVLPADHPDIASAMLNTAISYTKAGRHAEALDLHMQVLALRLRVLPADHPDIATAMSNAASSYAKLGRHAEALDLNEQALALRRRA